MWSMSEYTTAFIVKVGKWYINLNDISILYKSWEHDYEKYKPGTHIKIISKSGAEIIIDTPEAEIIVREYEKFLKNAS